MKTESWANLESVFYLQYLFTFENEEKLELILEYFKTMIQRNQDEQIYHLSPLFWFEFCDFVFRHGDRDLIESTHKTAIYSLFAKGSDLDCEGKSFYYLIEYLMGLTDKNLCTLLEQHIENGVHTLSDEQLINLSLHFINVKNEEISQNFERWIRGAG